MGHEAIKLELIEWLSKFEDEETINYLKIFKDSDVSKVDWWNELTDEQKSEIEMGLNDVDKGRVMPHDIVKQKYGL